jgi:hypothetical protein
VGGCAVALNADGGCSDDSECLRAESCRAGRCQPRATASEGEVEGEGEEPALPADCDVFDLARGRYALCRTPRTLADAKTTCAAADGRVVVFNDNESVAANVAEESGIGGIVAGNVGDGYWIGLSDVQQEDRYVWDDRTILDRSAGAQEARFAAGEPNDRGGEDCVQTIETGLWNDFDCELLSSTVCETASTFTSVPFGCTAAGAGGRSYLLCPTLVPYARALTTCQGVGGFPVVLGDHASASAQESERLAVLQLAQAATIGRYWLGLGDAVNEGSFVWGDGTKLNRTAGAGFDKFAPGEPNAANGEDCMITQPNRGWLDVTCVRLYATVCEL